MTDLELRIALAKFDGWIYLGQGNDLQRGNEDPHTGPIGYPPSGDYRSGMGAFVSGFGKPVFELPDYLHNLNAVADTEKLVRAKYGAESDIEIRYCKMLYDVSGNTTFATARQRSETLYKLLKWDKQNAEELEKNG